MIYDITPAIAPGLQVWPGDTPPQREVLLDLKKGDTVTLSTIHSTVHLGAHADGPNHYGPHAPGIEKADLEIYLGPCQVVKVQATRGERIAPELITCPITESRVLFRSETFPDPTDFNRDFSGLSPETVHFLHEKGVRLIGIDTPSVDAFDSKDLPSHNAFLEHEMAILEGLVLKDVPPGRYELIALPLKLVGFDASPVRAVLRDLE